MNRLTRKSSTLLCLVLVIAALASGCAQREANKALEQANQAKSEAQSALAPKFASDIFNEANQLLDLAQSQFDQGEYEQAQQTAQQAQARFLTAQQTVPEVRARVEDQLQQIGDALAEAEQNIATAREQGTEVLTPEEINQVATQVEELRNQFDSEVSPQWVEEDRLNNFLTQVQNLIPETEALAIAHLQPQAESALSNVEGLVQQAEQLDAATHAPDQYQQAMDLYAQIESANQDGNWQQVIDLSSQIEPLLGEAITISQREAADDIISDMEAQMAEVKGLNITGVDAFTNAIEQAESALQLAREQLNSEAYAAAISAADEVRNQIQQAYSALADEANSMISTAESNLQQALDLNAEQYAPGVVNTVRNSIQQTQELLNNDRQAEAYQVAQRAVQAAQGAPEAARRGKAEMALNEVEQPFSLLQQEGGEEYAEDAYERAEDAVNELRDMLEEGQYDAVEQGVPDAVALVEEGLEQLETVAEEILVQAEDVIEEAEESGAPDWVGMQYANAVNLRSSAEQALENDQFLTSIQRAEQSMDVARQAENQSYRLQVNQNLKRVNEMMVEAQRAEQDTLSPLTYREALEAREETLALLDSQQFREAFQQSQEAVEKANVAMNAVVLAAQQATDDAIEAGAMTYSSDEMNQALVLLNEAEAAQDVDNYAEANQKAQQASEIAADIEYFSWRLRSADLLRRLEGSVEELETQNAQEKTPALYRKVVTSLAKAKVAQVDEDFERCFEFADAAADAKQAVWDSMKADLTRQKMQLKQTAEWLGQQAQDTGGRDIAIGLIERINELNRQIDLQNWREAYSVASVAQRKADQKMDQMIRKNRYAFADELVAMVGDYEEVNALSIAPEQQEQIDQTIEMLRHPEDDVTYAEMLDAYNQAQQTISQLPDSIQEQASQRTEEIATVLQEAEDAGARDFFPDRTRELVSDLQWLRNSIEGDDLQGIAHRLRTLEKEAPALLAATELAVAEDNYLQNLQDQLSLANNLILDFESFTSYNKKLITAAQLTEYKIDENAANMYENLQTTISAKSFRINAELLLERVHDLNPPETLEGTQKKAIQSFEYLVRAGKGFEIYGETDTYDLNYREEAMLNAYDHLEKSIEVNEDLQFAIDSARDLTDWEKIKRSFSKFEEDFGEAYFNFSFR